jgi:hypothetical protein
MVRLRLGPASDDAPVAPLARAARHTTLCDVGGTLTSVLRPPAPLRRAAFPAILLLLPFARPDRYQPRIPPPVIQPTTPRPPPSESRRTHRQRDVRSYGRYPPLSYRQLPTRANSDMSSTEDEKKEGYVAEDVHIVRTLSEKPGSARIAKKEGDLDAAAAVSGSRWRCEQPWIDTY